MGNGLQLGSTHIVLERKIKSKRKAEIEKPLKRFISNFFKELGCYKIEIEQEIIYIFTHKSPDDHKLHRFSMAIKEALDLEMQQIANHHHHGTRKTNNAYLYVLRNCKITYKIQLRIETRNEGKVEVRSR
eukprot:TRINITY_DN13259_c0_g1_i1.p1 TRINITY_DN13259_c0_g1~~TRINITY_DN13259_c0_g1_i1.p1  ORF type:complete len:130 (+),score=7.56 TRINITY_DN13259_c0_g1_i1:51-440(+)